MLRVEIENISTGKTWLEDWNTVRGETHHDTVQRILSLWNDHLREGEHPRKVVRIVGTTQKSKRRF
jgi:broad specificity phosphatase PhoE